MAACSRGHSLGPRNRDARGDAILVNSVLDVGREREREHTCSFIHPNGFPQSRAAARIKKSPRIIRPRERLCAARTADIIVERIVEYGSVLKSSPPIDASSIDFFSFLFSLLLRVPFYRGSLSVTTATVHRYRNASPPVFSHRRKIELRVTKPS